MDWRGIDKGTRGQGDKEDRGAGEQGRGGERKDFSLKKINAQMQLPVDSQADKQHKLLEVAETYFRETVVPQAAAIDREPEVLRKALRGMGDRALLALRVAKDWGGSQLSELDFRRFQIMAARYSGALAFLQTQHQSAGSLLEASSNQSLKQEYLPRMARGKVLVGVGFSQLRRRGEPPIKAAPVSGGYHLYQFAKFLLHI